MRCDLKLKKNPKPTKQQVLKPEKQKMFTSFINISTIWPDFSMLSHHHRRGAFLTEPEAENSLGRSLSLTLLRGYKGLERGGSLLLLYHCGWGCQGGCDPQRALLSPLQALLQTHWCISPRHIQMHTNGGWSHEAGQGCVKKLDGSEKG